MSSSEPLIHLADVKKVFYTDEVETHALSGIHLDIKQGEYVSIAGPSGCGKSTLLSILGLLDTPTDGQYILNNHPVENLSLSERARIRNREVGFIFQSFNLIGDLTVYENVELPLTYRGMSSSERKKRATEALERVGMAHRAKRVTGSSMIRRRIGSLYRCSRRRATLIAQVRAGRGSAPLAGCLDKAPRLTFRNRALRR